jgi:quercetin 2,3-dioxygenase
MKLRSVATVLPAESMIEGGGFEVHRPFPTARVDQIDPFLLVDEFGPVTYAPGKAVGAPDHPHRGFEAVTYLLEGAHEHEDSAGNRGSMEAGDIQWMTAGSGLVHAEMPAQSILKHGGRVHGFQIWVNLPARDKMTPPGYQFIPAGRIPVAQADGARVKVIAGEYGGVTGPIQTRTPVLYLHATLQQHSTLTEFVPGSQNVFAYIIGGSGRFGAGSTPAHSRTVPVFEHDGEAVAVTAAEEPLEFLLLGGEPLNEPVARYGPFVMNFQGEIRKAILDYQEGRMGEIKRGS